MKTSKMLSLWLNFGAVFGVAMLFPLASIPAWFIAIQIVSVVAMARDKWAAQLKITRIPELTLLSLAALGGSPAVLAMRYIFKHKSSKQPFSNILYGICAVQVLFIILIKLLFFK